MPRTKASSPGGGPGDGLGGGPGGGGASGGPMPSDCANDISCAMEFGSFTDAVTLLAQEFHVLQVIYDGHGGTGEDFVSVENRRRSYV